MLKLVRPDLSCHARHKHFGPAEVIVCNCGLEPTETLSSHAVTVYIHIYYNYDYDCY